MFNKRLKEARLLKCLTQKDMCHQLNLSTNVYASWEQGRTEPNIDNICKLCKILDITADYLVGLENEDGTKISD